MLARVSLLVIFLTLHQLKATKISGVEDKLTAESRNVTTEDPKSLVDSIRSAILPGYDRLVRPDKFNESTSVKFGLYLRHLEIDENKRTATLLAWMRLIWQDKQLQWNESDYGGSNSIRVAPEEIWTPDIELYNMAANPTIGTKARALVFPKGEILWVAPARFDVLCKLNFKNWPRDSQTCRFLFGSWSYDANALNLTFFDKSGYEVDKMMWDDTGSSWQLDKVVAERSVKYYNCCSEPYITLQYDITVTKRGGGQIYINEAPVFALVALLVAAALRQPASRAAILAAVAVMCSMFLISLSIRLPHSTEAIPRVSIFYCGLLCLAAAWAVTSVVTERLSRLTMRPIPGSLLRFVKKSKLNIAGNGGVTAVSDDKEKSTESAAATSAAGTDSWAQLAALLDNAALLSGAVFLGLLFVLNI